MRVCSNEDLCLFLLKRRGEGRDKLESFVEDLVIDLELEEWVLLKMILSFGMGLL